MKWLQRWLGTERQTLLLERMAASLDSVTKAMSSNESAMQKGLRRLSMAQKQQSDTLERLVEASAKPGDVLPAPQGFGLSREQLLHTLDNLAKIALAASHTAASHPNTQEVIKPLIDRTMAQLLADCAVEPIARVGKPYPDHACEVLGATAHPEWPPGTVVEILQQGYQGSDKEVLRVAKVLVCGAVDDASHTDTNNHQEANYER